MINCDGLSFHRENIHIEARQDDHSRWKYLTRAVQLNSACDAGAKAILWSQDITDLPQQEAFPLEEPIRMFVEGRNKMTWIRGHTFGTRCQEGSQGTQKGIPDFN